MAHDTALNALESRWPAAVAVLAIGGLYMALPASLAVGPRWLQLLLISLLLVPTIVTHRRGQHRSNRILGHLLAGLITVFMIWSLALLILALPQHAEPPMILLRSAAALWLTNVLVFAYWYWRLDAGGPHGRAQRSAPDTGAFLFPQMAWTPQRPPHPAGHDPAPTWTPRFVDYLFLAFNTSTAFSPTDTPVLSRWAKVLTMIQSLISLAVIVLLAARAVNIL